MMTTVLDPDRRRVQDQQQKTRAEDSSPRWEGVRRAKNERLVISDDPETFKNAEFKRGMKNSFSPDGHAVRFIISHQGIDATGGLFRI